MKNISDYKTVFIGHANPEDNYFSAWLASKLLLMGYDVWCDLEAFQGGEDVWISVTRKIREESAKYLFVTSTSSVKKDGTLKELAVAEAIKDRGDFILPLRLDNIEFKDFPAEIIRKYTIDFSNGWDDGLQKLAEKLLKDNVPRTENDGSSLLPFWYQASGVDDDKPLDRPERYLSNWFEIELPTHLYFHTLELFQKLQLDSIQLPFMLEKNFLISFACSDCLKDYVAIRKSEELDTNEFLTSREFPHPKTGQAILDTNKKVVQLLNDSFDRFLLSKGLQKYKLSGPRFTYYFPSEYSGMVSLKKYGRRGRTLLGQVKSLNWHFALEPASFLQPLPAYFITYHVIFTKDGLPLTSAAAQHTLRRSTGKDWYNDKWRDMLLAAMLSLADENGDVLLIPVCKHNSIKVSILPIAFQSNKGYSEPGDIEDNE